MEAITRMSVLSDAMSTKEGQEVVKTYKKLIKLRCTIGEKVAILLPVLIACIQENTGENVIKNGDIINSLADIFAQVEGGETSEYKRMATNALKSAPCMAFFKADNVEIVMQNAGNKNPSPGRKSKKKKQPKNKGNITPPPPIPQNEPLIFQIDFRGIESSEDKLNKLITATREMAKALKIDFKMLNLENALRDLVS